MYLKIISTFRGMSWKIGSLWIIHENQSYTKGTQKVYLRITSAKPKVILMEHSIYHVFRTKYWMNSHCLGHMKTLTDEVKADSGKKKPQTIVSGDSCLESLSYFIAIIF